MVYTYNYDLKNKKEITLENIIEKLKYNKNDGTKISSMDDLNKIKNSHKIGDEMKIKVNRNGQEKDLTITLGEQP